MMNVTWLRLASTLTPALMLLGACSATGSGTSSPADTASGSGAGGATSGSEVGSTGNSTQSGDPTLAGGVGNGSSGSGDGTGGGVDCSGGLPVIIRDFTTSNHDFEPGSDGDDKNIVTDTLGEDGKPVYGGGDKTSTTKGKASFDQWYRDVNGINMNIPKTLPLTMGKNGVYTYDNQSFFPIDGEGFGNEGNNHNFHFTDEVHTIFTYKGGEEFTFTGDDDLFAYVNKKLVINLGGIHQAETATVKLDEVAQKLGLVKGQKYPLDLFGAERHVTESHYRIDTTIDCFINPPPPK